MKIKIALAAGFLLMTLHQLHAQKLNWDSTFRPPNYALIKEQFESYPKTANDFIFLGNSITERTEWSELLMLPNAKNRGISSDITFGVLERLGEVTSRKPAKLFILIGINDISRNIPDSVILNNYKRIIRQVKQQSPRTKIYFQTLLPVNNEFPPRNQFNKDEHILYVNSELKKIAVKEKINLIDLHPYFLNEANKLDKKYTTDGLHLNAGGYKLWKKILQKGKYLKN